MPKPINQTIGKCLCAYGKCEKAADVRRCKNHERGRRYLVCPDHGIIRASSAASQRSLDEWIDNNMVNNDVPSPGPAPGTEKGGEVPVSEPEKKPVESREVPAPKPEPKKKTLDEELSDLVGF